jgi:hypothetical protein
VAARGPLPPADVSPAGYVDLHALAAYSGLSVRTLRKHIADPVHPLPTHHVRLTGVERGRVLVSLAEFDTWVRSFPPVTGGRARRDDDPTDTAWITRALDK